MPHTTHSVGPGEFSTELRIFSFSLFFTVFTWSLVNALKKNVLTPLFLAAIDAHDNTSLTLCPPLPKHRMPGSKAYAGDGNGQLRSGCLVQSGLHEDPLTFTVSGHKVRLGLFLIEAAQWIILLLITYGLWVLYRKRSVIWSVFQQESDDDVDAKV